MPVLIATVGAASVFLFALWYLRSRNTMEVRIRALGQQQRMVAEHDDPFTQRVAFPIVNSLVNTVMSLMPTSLIFRARRWLLTAGDTTSLSQFFTIVLVASTALPAVYFALVYIGSSGSPSAQALLGVPIAAAFGLFAPFFILRRIAKNRQRRIWKSMPNAMDLLTTCVEAGLSLDFGLQRVADRYKGPLSEEIQRMLREVGLGKTRREALTAMADRINIPDVTTFVNSIIQAEALGTSIGQVLRTQAIDMRRRRRQHAEQVARRAPVKMVFPLVFCLLPSLFIVTLGPVGIKVVQTFEDM